MEEEKNVNELFELCINSTPEHESFVDPVSGVKFKVKYIDSHQLIHKLTKTFESLLKSKVTVEDKESNKVHYLTDEEKSLAVVCFTRVIEPSFTLEQWLEISHKNVRLALFLASSINTMDGMVTPENLNTFKKGALFRE